MSAGRFPPTDEGNGQRFAARYGKVLRFSMAHRSWCFFNGERWLRGWEAQGEVERAAKQIVSDLWAEVRSEPDVDRQNDLYRHAKRSGSWRAILAVLCYAKKQPGMLIEDEEMASRASEGGA